jgi:hypothetical protein
MGLSAGRPVRVATLRGIDIGRAGRRLREERAAPTSSLALAPELGLQRVEPAREGQA